MGQNQYPEQLLPQLELANTGLVEQNGYNSSMLRLLKSSIFSLGLLFGSLGAHFAPQYLLPAYAEAKDQSSLRTLVGTYNGNQMEIAAGLELKADHHFSYALAYGALDEEAAGTWTVHGDQLLLTSDPVTPPRFVLVSQTHAADGKLQINLDVPTGMSQQYFDALITNTNGETEQKQLSENGLESEFPSTNKPAKVRMLLSIFDVVSQPVNLDSNSGYSLRFCFEPHDLGKVAFQATPLKIVDGELLLDRHGRTIRFKHSGTQSN
jgi:hypothetical protein